MEETAPSGRGGAIMLPESFDYSSPKSLIEALEILSSSDFEVKVLAGGQSLIPSMRIKIAFSKKHSGYNRHQRSPIPRAIRSTL